MIGEIHLCVTFFIHTVYWFGAKTFRVKCKARYHIYIMFLYLSGIHICNKCMKTSLVNTWCLRFEKTGGFKYTIQLSFLKSANFFLVESKKIYILNFYISRNVIFINSIF